MTDFLFQVLFENLLLRKQEQDEVDNYCFYLEGVRGEGSVAQKSNFYL